MTSKREDDYTEAEELIFQEIETTLSRRALSEKRGNDSG